MVTITFISQEGMCTGFEASGHAGYSLIGTDIVCAAVSALIQGTVLSVERLIGKTVVREENGVRLSCHIRDPDGMTQLLFASLELSLTEIQAGYSNYVEVCHG